MQMINKVILLLNFVKLLTSFGKSFQAFLNYNLMGTNPSPNTNVLLFNISLQQVDKQETRGALSSFIKGIIPILLLISVENTDFSGRTLNDSSYSIVRSCDMLCQLISWTRANFQSGIKYEIEL